MTLEKGLRSTRKVDVKSKSKGENYHLVNTPHKYVNTYKDKLEDMDVSLKKGAARSGPTLQT